jgi:hypothetical protein
MHSTLADMGTWAASLSGNTTLSDELASERLELHDAGLGVFDYGLGIMRAGTQLGHEGEAIGWEGWAGYDPDSGETVVVFTTTCSSSPALFSALAVLDPGMQQLADIFNP